MRKTERLQIRLTEEQAEFIKHYSVSKNITISQMMRDFINWLKKKEEKVNGDQGEA